jgi:hypothetical protein
LIAFPQTILSTASCSIALKALFLRDASMKSEKGKKKEEHGRTLHFWSKIVAL